MYLKPKSVEIDPASIPAPRVLPSGRKLVTPEQRAFMKMLYLDKGLSSWRIGQTMGYLNVCVINNLKRAGVELRSRVDAAKTLAVKRGYFEKIDTPTKAYLLGLFYADGNVHEDTFTLALQEPDKHLLKSIAAELGMTGALGLRPRRGFGKQNMWALRIYDKEFCANLRRLGVVPRKTSNLSYPSFLEGKFFYSFLHGLLDGDGCISTRGKRINMNIAGSPNMTEDLKKIIESRLDVHTIRCLRPKSKGTTLDINGANAVRILGLMYLNSGAPFCLTRKKAKFLNYLRDRVMMPITHCTQLTTSSLAKQYLSQLS